MTVYLKNKYPPLSLSISLCHMMREKKNSARTLLQVLIQETNQHRKYSYLNSGLTVHLHSTSQAPPPTTRELPPPGVAPNLWVAILFVPTHTSLHKPGEKKEHNQTSLGKPPTHRWTGGYRDVLSRVDLNPYPGAYYVVRKKNYTVTAHHAHTHAFCGRQTKQKTAGLYTTSTG